MLSKTLAELRRRGHELGLISVCSQDVPQRLGRDPLGGEFDATVFSCDVGVSKPDPRIYEIACERLAVEPADCLFVGDGANDELPGAERAGMTALQLRAPGEPLTPEGEVWTGPGSSDSATFSHWPDERQSGCVASSTRSVALPARSVTASTDVSGRVVVYENARRRSSGDQLGASSTESKTFRGSALPARRYRSASSFPPSHRR